MDKKRSSESLNAVLITGKAHPALAKAIAKAYGHPLADATISRFSDGETRVEINENLRQRDVFLIQPTCPPVNDSIMELAIMADACRRASARRVTAVVPYFGYSRQDRKSASRSPITSKLVMDILVDAGIERVLSMDLHAPQVQGFANIPVDNLYSLPVMATDIKTTYKNADLVVVSPDVGGVRRARALAKELDCPMAIIDKRRDAPNQSKILHVIGDVKGKTCVLYDDMIDTAGTICQAAKTLREDKGAAQVVAYASHGVLSGPALARLEASELTETVLTNSIPAPKGSEAARIRTLDVAPLLAEAMHRIITGASLSALFE